MSENRRSLLKASMIATLAAGVIAVSAGLLASTAQADPADTNAVNAPANSIHPGLLAAGATNNNASPGNQGNGNTNDAGLHGIENVPGQDKNNKPSGQGGFADSLAALVHGGIDDVNPVAAGTLP